MVYLDNTTSAQTVWIPRNDEGEYIHTGSSGSYKEGFADGYESGVTDGYGSGYTSGHTDGMDDQKELLSSTTFTENGVYTREDGWSSVTVYVTSGAPQSLEDKDVVISADTTTVTPSPGYYGISAVTIDASEYAQENYDNGFDDGFGDGYASGATDGYEEGYGSGYTSGYTSGSTDGYGSGYTDGYYGGYLSGETHQKSLLTSTAITENGIYTREDGFSAITVDVPTSGSPSLLGTASFSANGTYSASTDNLDGYSAITIDVQESYFPLEMVDYIETTCVLDTGQKHTIGESYEIDLMIVSASGYYNRTGDTNYYAFGTYYMLDINYDAWTRKIGANYRFDTGNAKRSVQLPITLDQRAVVGLTKSAITVNGSVVGDTYTKGWNATSAFNVWLGGSNDSYGVSKHRCIGRYYGLKKYSEEGDLVYDFIPVVYEGEPYFYDKVSGSLKKIACGTAGPSKGYVEGYASGHTDGVNEEKAKLSAITITSNTAITKNEGGYSAITVNVQDGCAEDFYCIYADYCEFQFPVPSNVKTIDNIYIGVGTKDDGAADVGAYDSDRFLYEFGSVSARYNEVSGEYFGPYVSGKYYSGNGTTQLSNVIKFPDHGSLRLGRGYVEYEGTKAFSATYRTTTASTVEVSLSNAYLFSGMINNATYCLIPTVDANGNACVYFNGNYYYPTYGKAYPVYTNGATYYIKQLIS